MLGKLWEVSLFFFPSESFDFVSKSSLSFISDFNKWLVGKVGSSKGGKFEDLQISNIVILVYVTTKSFSGSLSSVVGCLLWPRPEPHTQKQ